MFFLMYLPSADQCEGELKELLQDLNPDEANLLLVIDIFRHHQSLSTALQFNEKQAALVRQMSGKLIDAERTVHSRAKSRKNDSYNSDDTRQFSIKLEKALEEGCDLAAKIFVQIKDHKKDDKNNLEMLDFLEEKVKEDFDQVVNGMEAKDDKQAAGRAIRETGSYSRSEIITATGDVMNPKDLDDDTKKDLFYQMKLEMKEKMRKMKVLEQKLRML
jgi:hypothetical protein